MSTATKPAARTTIRKPAGKASAPKEPTAKPTPTQKAEAVKARAAIANTSPIEPKAETLIDALTLGETSLIKVRANKTQRSLPYLAVGSERRKQAEAVAKMRGNGDTVDAISGALNVSTATARRFITSLELAQAVEEGKFDPAWKPGIKAVVVHTVTTKQAKA